VSYYKNLVPGQWQIGDIVMGTGTNIKVQKAEVAPDDINKQDYQVARTDEMRFGVDQLKPTTIELTLSVLHNRLLEEWESYVSNFWHSMPSLDDLKKEWRYDQGRLIWGKMHHLYVCSKLDGIPKVVFGRPGQFKYNIDDEYNKGEVVGVVAEFRRADTVAYSATEYVTEIFMENAPATIVRSKGDVDTWLSIIGYGPITNPVITIGEQQIALNIDLAAGEAFEVSSYPWQRRAIDSNRNNLAAAMTGETRYLDKIVLKAGKNTPVRWTSDQITTFVPDLNNESWQEDINNLDNKTLPSTFTTLHGKVVIRLDLLNPDWAEKYIANDVWANKSACIYNKHQFRTSDQQSEVTLTETYGGRSAIAIMSNSTMTNYAMVEISTGAGNNKLILRTGSSPTSFSGVLAEWENPAFFGWTETDRIGIKSDYDAGTNVVTYSALFNNEVKCTWADTSRVVSNANRYQGYLFDMDGNLFTTGTGFRKLLSFDHRVVPVGPEIPGKMFFLWRDAYSVI
jgi:hypothetical protein